MLGLQVQFFTTGSGDPNPDLCACAAGTSLTKTSAGPSPLVGLGVEPETSHQLSKYFTTEPCHQFRIRHSFLPGACSPTWYSPCQTHGSFFSGGDQMRCHNVCRASPTAAACFSEPSWKENRVVFPRTPHSVTSPRSLGVISFIGHVRGRLWHLLFYLKNEHPVLAVTGEVDREHCGKQGEGGSVCLAQPHTVCTWCTGVSGPPCHWRLHCWADIWNWSLRVTACQSLHVLTSPVQGLHQQHAVPSSLHPKVSPGQLLHVLLRGQDLTLD